MRKIVLKQKIQKLEKQKGGYYYLKVSADEVNKLEKKQRARCICTIDKTLTLRCGLNHLGDGNFFIIISGKNFKTLGKVLGDQVCAEIIEDPNPLGVEIPEVLFALLAQDHEAKAIFEQLTDGKKRSIIFQISKYKDIDKAVTRSLKLLRDFSKN